MKKQCLTNFLFLHLAYVCSNDTIQNNLEHCNKFVCAIAYFVLIFQARMSGPVLFSYLFLITYIFLPFVDPFLCINNVFKFQISKKFSQTYCMTKKNI